jgi:hypothetical protein
VKTIEITPKMFSRVTSKHQSLCEEKGVILAPGYYKPQGTWEAKERIQPAYYEGQAFFTNLQGEQRAAFCELIELGVESAVMVARYFCLAGEEYIPQRELAEEYGCVLGSANRRIAFIRCYLDEQYDAGREAAGNAAALKRRLLKLNQSDTTGRAGGLMSGVAPRAIPASQD